MTARDGPRDDLRGRTTGANVLAGALWTILANGLAPMLLLMQSIVAARFLGPTGMGRQSYIAWVELTVSFALSAGASGTLSRFLGQTVGSGRGGPMRTVLATLTKLQLAAAVLPVLLLAGIIAPHAAPSLRAPWVLAGVAGGLLVAQSAPSTALVALQRWRQAAVVSLVTGALATVGTVVVLAVGWGITGMFAVEVGALVVSGLWSASLARVAVRDVLPPAEPAGPLRREVFRYAGLATLQLGLAYLVWQRSEFFFLDRYGTARQIAMYSIAFAAVSGLQRLPEGLTQPLIPSLSVLVGTGERERLAGATARAFRLIWSVGVPLAAALMTMGPLALRLVYGNSYRAAGDVVVVLAAALPIVLLSRVGAAVLHAFGRVSTLLACLALAVSADAVACVLLVPAHGSVGAAIANVVGQVVAATLEIWCAARAMGAGVLRLPWVQMARATAVSAAGAAAAYAVASSFPSAWGLLAALVAGAAVFAAAFWLIPTVAVEDLAWLDGITATRFGGRLRPVVRTLWRRAAGGTAPALDGPSG